jgi:ABC-type sugar transport system substrate-binding protein
VDLSKYEAQATAAQGALANTTFPGPTDTFAAPQNIKLAVVACSTSVGGCLSSANGVKAAAEVLHWKVKIFNGNSDPTTQNHLIEQAANSGYQAIILAAIDPSQIKSGLAAAHAKNIPVGSVTAGVAPSAGGVAYDTGANWTKAGTALGALVVAQSKGKAHMLPFMDKEFQSQVDLINAVMAEVRTCSTCAVEPVQQFIYADVGPKLGVRVVNLLQKTPAINYVDMGYDPAADVVVPAIQQAGLGDRVSLIAANGEPQNLNWMKQGTVQTGDLVFSFIYSAYAAVDQMARLLAHKPLIKDASEPNEAYAYGEGAPWGVITPENLSSIGIPAAGKNITFAIEAQLPQLYGKIWGISS